MIFREFRIRTGKMAQRTALASHPPDYYHCFLACVDLRTLQIHK